MSEQKETHRFDLRHEPGGLRHYLAGKPVHAGDQVEILTDGGWVQARYEWTFSESSPAWACIDDDNAIAITEDTLARWCI